MLHCTDDQFAVRRQPEKKKPVALPVDVVLRQQRPRISDDREINTIRITAIKNSLRPTVLPVKHQTKDDGKSLELLIRYSARLVAPSGEQL